MDNCVLLNILNVFLRMGLLLYGLMDRIYVRMNYIAWGNQCRKMNELQAYINANFFGVLGGIVA